MFISSLYILSVFKTIAIVSMFKCTIVDNALCGEFRMYIQDPNVLTRS